MRHCEAYWTSKVVRYFPNEVPAGFVGWRVVYVGGSVTPEEDSEDMEDGDEGSACLAGVPSKIDTIALSSSRLGLPGGRRTLAVSVG